MQQRHLAVLLVAGWGCSGHAVTARPGGGRDRRRGTLPRIQIQIQIMEIQIVEVQIREDGFALAQGRGLPLLNHPEERPGRGGGDTVLGAELGCGGEVAVVMGVGVRAGAGRLSAPQATICMQAVRCSAGWCRELCCGAVWCVVWCGRCVDVRDEEQWGWRVEVC